LALESQITNRILKYLNGLEDCVAEKVMGNAFQFGRPDINACWKGRSVRIEVKTPDHGNKPSKAQELNLRLWDKAGALAFVAYSLEDVKERIFDGVGD
jgi:hypothetical protein